MSGEPALLGGPRFVTLLTPVNYGLPKPVFLYPPCFISPLLAYLWGKGRITGTVKVTPATPVARRVVLLREPGLQVVTETVSNPATGEYVFDRINPAVTYTVVSYDHTGQYRAVIADNQAPELIP